MTKICILYEYIKAYRRFFLKTKKYYISNKQFGKSGKFSIIENPIFIENPQSVFLEDPVRIREHVRIINAPNELIYIKRFSVIAAGVTIVSNSHRSTVGIPQILLGASHVNDKSSNIYIDEDVWVGANATILPNVHLGRGCIVSAGAVVTRSVPPYAVVAGIPAKIIKVKFSIKGIVEHEKVLYDEEDRILEKELVELFDRFYSQISTYGSEEYLSKANYKKVESANKNYGDIIDSSYFLRLKTRLKDET